MELIQTYNSYPDALKDQIKLLKFKFNVSKDVENYYRHIIKETKGIKFSEHEKKILFRLAILTIIKPYELLIDCFFTYVYCYKNNSKDKIIFNKLIKDGKHARVVKGKDIKGNSMVVKYYSSNKRDTCFEIGIYERLRDEGMMTLPYFDTEYFFWDSRVLVMEKLSKLNHKDDEYELAIQIIEQLKSVHMFGVHSDIKPENMMKKRNYKNKKTVYYLIDFGGVSNEKLEYGYRRYIWSPKWTCQKSHEKNQITTFKHDFIELGYTMRHIQNLKNKSKKGEIKSGYRGKLKKYMDFVSNIDEMNIPDDIHDQLIKVIKHA